MGAGIGRAREGFERALGLHRAGDLPGAESLYRELIAAGDPSASDARINLGTILDQRGRHEEALSEYRQALGSRPGDPLALNNMGNSLTKLGRFAEAAESFRLALQQAPEFLEARVALGAALQREGDLAGAIVCFCQTLERDPSHAEAHWNLSLALLMAGEFREGWQEYEWRWLRESFTSPRRGFREPLWDGSPVAGRRLLVHAEQGLGDTIQFCRYLPHLAAAGATVLVECQSASLRPLLERLPGVASVHVMGEELPPFDLQVPLLSLPRLFATTLDNLPSRVPYLEAPPARLALWRERLLRYDGVKVGVVWAGKPLPDPFRSCSLEALAPLGELPGVSLFSLQVGEAAGTAGAGPALIDLTHQIHDFADTAALISQLDLVISVDTSVAHLAGALGKPVWLLLPRAGDYRWLLEREDSPWYPTMRIFRQKRQGEWGEVVERLRDELDQAAWGFLEQAAAREPFNGWRCHLCGEFLAARGRHREATVRFSKAAQLLPGHWQPHYGLGGALQQMGRLAEAEESFRAAVLLAPQLAPLHEALGVALQSLGDREGAIGSYREALGLDAALVRSRYNLAIACRETGRFREALEGFAEVVRLSPGHADAHWNLGIMLLMAGDYRSGWREFSWRFKKSAQPPQARWQDRPRWDGSAFPDRTLLLWGEQGLGDTLQFIRYATLAAGRGGRVVVEVQSAALARLVSRVAGVSSVIVAGHEPPQFDLQASLMELPGIFESDGASIPDAVPYLHADAPPPGLIAPDRSLKVGLVWGGNPAHENDANRSLATERLALLAGLPEVTFYSLQLAPTIPSPGGGGSGRGKEKTPDSTPSPLRGEEGVSELQLKDLSGAINDFCDTAALASGLDLVITVDTSVAHLCGGLGIPVWVLIPFIPDWRWLLEREDSPWYPTMRLFRQRSPGDWDGVLLLVREALSRAASGEMTGAEESWVNLSAEGRFAEAARELQKALSLKPRDVEVVNNLGCALDNGGRHLEAVAVYRRGVAVEPGFMALHYNMGNSLKALGRTDEAIDCYRRALALDPALPQGWHNLGLSLQETGSYDDALHALERAVALCPDYLEARHNLGELHHARGELERARERFREVLAQDPQHLPSWNALGIALQVQERLEEAVECYEKALSLNPRYLHALNNLGAASRALGLFDKAIACYEKVLALDPEYADAHWNLSLVQLQLGRYREGWRGYEWRFRKADPIPARQFPQPRWDGADLSGRTILLHAEQGFGDTLQFVRYAANVAAMGGTVLVECQSGAVAPLLERVPGVSRVLSRGEEIPPFDLHASLMSLPFLCGTLLQTIPAPVPYLFADPALSQSWRLRLGGAGLKVGLVWAGRKSYKDDAKRSLSLPLFAPLAGARGVRFYALQVGAGAEQAAHPPAGMELCDLGPGIKSFADSAAIIANLDLVISADTAVAHLAGGMGKPVWVLLPSACDWRWLTGRDDSPWYPTARLFRQSRRGDWNEVLKRVALKLEELTP